MGATPPTLSGLEIFPKKNFPKERKQMHPTQYFVLFVTYREGSNMNTGNKNPIVLDEGSSFSRLSMSSLLVFDNEKKLNKNFLLWMIQIVSVL